MSETSMIERVAKELAWDHHRTYENWEEWTGAARAAIEAMREPTEAMTEAGVSILCGFETFTTRESYWAKATHRAMLDAALSEKP